MKKLVVGILLGFALHMLYLDAILVKQHYIIDNCPQEEKADKNGELPCLKYGNSTSSRYYGKWFGIYSLIPWKQVVTGPWRPE